MSESENPIPMRDIPYGAVMHLAASHGFDQVVLIARKEGRDGGECVVSAGITHRDASIADEIARFLKREVMGWKSEEAPTTLPTGPAHDPDLGNRIMLPGLKKS
ncbi:MAG: hypothetical protein KGL39_14665 [Patescibacteria group bacterium]|nr:hypothetical protein [Patescibacteria group bacterium]